MMKIVDMLTTKQIKQLKNKTTCMARPLDYFVCILEVSGILTILINVS